MTFAHLLFQSPSLFLASLLLPKGGYQQKCLHLPPDLNMSDVEEIFIAPPHFPKMERSALILKM
jgi:hypothetical protein